MSVATVIVLACLGLIFGSFLNASVWRLHEQAELAKRPKKGKTKNRKIAITADRLSILRGRSLCPNCGHVLAASDLVPIFSWLFLRGECRYCKHPISWQYPLVELITASVFVFSYYFWPLSLSGYGLVSFCFWLALTVGFIALFIFDLKWYILPDKIVWPLVGLVVIELLVKIIFYGGGLQAIYIAALGALLIAGLFFILFAVSDGHWIGGGDVKLGLVIGILLSGIEPSFLMLFIASLLGTFVSLPFLAMRRLHRTSMLPFGPFLLVATTIMVLFGGSIMHWLHGVLYIS